MINMIGKKKNSGTVLAALAGATLLAGISSMPAQAEETVTVATSVEVFDTFVPQIGDQQGIFQKHGIKLNYVRSAGGPAILAAVIGGSADVTHVGAALSFPAIAKGAELKLLMGNYDLDYTFIVRKDLGADTSKPYPENLLSLKGKDIGVAARGGATEFYARKIFSDAGLNPDSDISLVAVGTGVAAAGAFTQGLINGLVNIPPTSEIIGKDNYDQLIDLKTTRGTVYDPDYLSGTIFTANAAFVEQRPEVAKSFCEAVKETMDFMHDPANKPKIVEFTAKNFHLNEEQAGELVSTYISGFNPILNEKRWESTKKYVPNTPDFSKYTYKPCADIANAS